MAKGYYSFALAGMLYLASVFFSSGAEALQSLSQQSLSQQSANEDPLQRGLLRRETPTEVVTEVVEKGKIEKKDIVNFISRIDDEKIDNRKKYAKLGYLEGFYEALKDRIEEDPFFYVGEKYDNNDIIVENQMLNAGWDIGVAKFPGIFGRLEKTGVYLKRKTTLKADMAGYRLKFSPELDNKELLKIKMQVRAKHSLFDRLEFKVGRDDVEAEKSWNLSQISEKAEVCADVKYNWNDGEYCARVLVKFPFLFEKKDKGEIEYRKKREIEEREARAKEAEESQKKNERQTEEILSGMK